MSGSEHMLNRLRLVREVDTIRQAVPADSFRTAAANEAKIRAAVLKKTLEQMQAGGAVPAAASAPAAAGGAAPSPAAAAGGAASPFPRPLVRPMVPSAAAAPAAAAPPAPAAPALPFVYRRAARDVQITDPSSGDLLQLDRGSWVLTAAAPHPATHLLPVYTVDPKTGLVVTYDIPVPGNHLPGIFDLHTLNMIETLSEPATHAHAQHPAAAATPAAGTSGMVLPEGYYDHRRG